MIANINTRLLKQLVPKQNSYDVRDQQIRGFMIRVYPSGKMTYKCEYARGKRITIGDAKVLTVAQARERAKQVLGDAARGLDPKAAKEARKYGTKIINFKTFFENEYKPWLQVNKPDTWQMTCRRLENRFMSYLGHLPLSEITPHLIDKWRVRRLTKDGVQALTANKEIIMLKAVLSRAKKWQFVKEHPLSNFEMGELGDNSRVRFLDEQEYARLLAALEVEEERLRTERDCYNQWRAKRNLPPYPDLRQRRFAHSLTPKVLVTLGSGVRTCELRRMRRHRHIDFKRQGLYLTPDITKAKKSRYIPLDEKTWQVLTDWLVQTKDQYAKDSLVFPGKNGNTEFNNMTKSWKRLLRVAKIDHFTWHDMRHDYASQLVMSGVDLNTVRELLGHASLKMTLRYAHLAPAHKKTAVQSLQHRRDNMLIKGKNHA